jgi:hypothetical protein
MCLLTGKWIEITKELVKFCILVGGGAASLDDWCPMFEDGLVVSYSRIEMSMRNLSSWT